MMRFAIVVCCLAVGVGAAMAQTQDLLISEYVEGTGDNNALEIYNGTEDVINLSGYSIERYANGATTPVSIPLAAFDLDAGAAFVVTSSLADAALLALADQIDANLVFNGNDALVLVFGGSTIVDSFGTVGVDPGTAWSCAGGSTANHTLRRLSSICSGDMLTTDAFDPCTEWSFAPSDVFSGLGDHIADCGAVPTDPPNWGSLKAQYR